MKVGNKIKRYSIRNEMNTIIDNINGNNVLIHINGAETINSASDSISSFLGYVSRKAISRV